MRKILLSAVVLLALGTERSRAQQYGWPPPNYSVTGVRAEDGYHYRGLCQILRDRGWGCRLRRNKMEPEPASPAAEEGPAPAILMPPQATVPTAQ